MKMPKLFSFIVLLLFCIIRETPTADDLCASPWPPPKHNRECYIIAHRGVHTAAPENTIPAFEKAMELGLDYIEVDVRTSKDGRLFILHNDTVDARTNGSGTARELLWKDLRDLDAGSWFAPKFAGTRLPTFEEVLQLTKGRIGLYLDLKDADTEKVVSFLRKYGMIKDVVVYADEDQLLDFVRLQPNIKIMPDPGTPERTGEILDRFQPRVVAYTWNGITKECVEKCHAAGAKVFLDVLGEGDNRDGMNRVLDWGTDGLQTDRPELLIEVLAERKKKKRRSEIQKE